MLFYGDTIFEVQESDNFSGNFYNAFLMSPQYIFIMKSLVFWRNRNFFLFPYE